MTSENTAILQTSLGTLKLALYSNEAPKTVENFTGLIQKGYYDGVVFHRVIKNFMIQGGDPTGTGRGGDSIWGQPFEDECHPELKFDKPGLLAMANAGPGTNGSQFFITTAPTPWLHMQHTLFGEVIEGMETLKEMENVSTDRQDRPQTPLVIEKATLA